MTKIDLFIWGLGAGASFITLIWSISDRLYAKTLISKADRNHRTAEYIKGKFYYIVPEKEYVERLMTHAERRDE